MNKGRDAPPQRATFEGKLDSVLIMKNIRKLRHLKTGLVAALSLGAATMDAATLLEYNFNEISQNRLTFFDSSGNGRDLHMRKAANLSSDNPFGGDTPTAEENKSGLYVAPKSASNAGDIQGIEEGLGISNAFTIQAWVKPSSFEGGADLILLHSTTSNGGRIQLGFDPNGRSYAYVTKDGKTEEFWVSGGAVDEWMHLAFTYDGSTLNFYKNGEVVGSRAASLSDLSHIDKGAIFVGGRGYIGAFDDIGIYDTALKQEELGFHQPFASIPEPGNIALLSLTALGGWTIARKLKVQPF